MPPDFPSLIFIEYPVSGGIVYEANGVVKVPETAGLGATIDERWLGMMEKVVL